MGFLKVLGWILVPFIMIFVRWKQLRTASKVFGTPWAVISLIIFISVIANSGSNQTVSTSAQISETTKLSDKKDITKEETAEKAKKEAENQAKKDADKKAADEQKLKSKVADGFKNLIPKLTDGGKMDDVTYKYIVDNYTLFPAKNDVDIQTVKSKVDTSITTKHLAKNIQPYYDKMVQFTGRVISVEENNTDLGTIAYIHIMTQDGDSITAVYMNSTGDLLEGDTATIIGVPSVAYSFQNVSGGHTNAILLSASLVEKRM